MEMRPLSADQVQMLIVPGVVCLAFSIELGLKALAEAEGAKSWGHRFAELFNRLSPGLQQSLVGDTGLSRSAFSAELATATDTFVEWRYVHEQSRPRANLQFLQAFARAIQKALVLPSEIHRPRGAIV
jgi:hypothetical protein